MTLPETTCVVLGCDRAVLRGRSSVYSRCEAHVLALTRGAFGAPSGAPEPDRLTPRLIGSDPPPVAPPAA